MAGILGSITVDGVTKLMDERKSYYWKNDSFSLSANSTTNVVSKAIAFPGLYMFTGWVWFKDGASTGARTTYIDITSDVATTPYVQASQRAANQYGVYMTTTVSMYVDPSLKTVLFRLRAMSSMACSANQAFLLCERVYPVIDG